MLAYRQCFTICLTIYKLLKSSIRDMSRILTYRQIVTNIHIQIKCYTYLPIDKLLHLITSRYFVTCKHQQTSCYILLSAEKLLKALTYRQAHHQERHVRRCLQMIRGLQLLHRLYTLAMLADLLKSK